MSAPPASASGPSMPGGELQQISPGAWPTANGSQMENSVPLTPIPPVPSSSINSAAEQLRDNWERNKIGLRRKFGELTDEDLLYVAGQEAALLDRIQQKTGRPRTEIAAALNLQP